MIEADDTPASATASAHPPGEPPVAAEFPEELSLELFPAQAPKKRGRPQHKLQDLLAALPDPVASGTPELAEGPCFAIGPSGPPPPPEHTTPATASHTPANLGLVPAVRSYQRQSVRGFPLPSITTGALDFCVAQSSAAPTDSHDQDYQKLADTYLHKPGSFHLTSAVVLGEKLGIPSNRLENKLCRLACAHLAFSRLQQIRLEKALASSATSSLLLAYCECQTYDETPLRVALQGEPAAASTQERCGQAVVSDVQGWSMLQNLELSLKQEATIAKIMQLYNATGMLVKVGDVFIKLVTDQPCQLQCLQRTTAEVITQCLTRACTTSTWAQSFLFRSRMSSTDKAPSNHRAERATLSARPAGWSSLSLSCEVHDNARTLGSTYDGLVPEQVTGILACALSLRHTGALTMFRTALKEEIGSRLDILRGAPDADALAHKHQLMDVYFAAGSKTVAQMVLLSALPNGDWRNSETVEHYIDVDVPAPSKTSVAATLEAGLCHALLNKKPHPWARHRWTGFELALDELALLESIHKLLSTSYKRLIVKMSRPQRSVASGPGPSAAEGLAPPGPSFEANRRDPELAPLSEVAGIRQLEGDGPGPASSGQPEEGAGFAEQNAADRRKAAEWLSSNPVNHLYCMRVTLEPLRQLLSSQFLVASKAWEIDQRAYLLDLASKQALDKSTLQRDYLLRLAGDKVLEKRYFHDLAGLFTKQEVWDCVEEECRTVCFNHLVFKLLSRQGCLIQRHLAQPHGCFPIKLFSPLEGPLEGDGYGQRQTMCHG